jgi:membrane protein DedA with SNARE-associated domain
MEFLRNAFLILGFWTYLIVGLELFLECSAFLGVILPGDSIAVLTGVLAGQNVLCLWGAVMAIVGAVFLGDTSGYLLGRYRGQAVLSWSRRAKRLYDRRHEQVERYAHRWGKWIVVIGRFLPFLRAVTPFSVGIGGMAPARFVPAAAVASIFWGGAFFVLGYEFSQHFRKLEAYLIPLGYASVAILIALACLWLYRRYVKKSAASAASADRS